MLWQRCRFNPPGGSRYLGTWHGDIACWIGFNVSIRRADHDTWEPDCFVPLHQVWAVFQSAGRITIPGNVSAPAGKRYIKSVSIRRADHDTWELPPISIREIRNFLVSIRRADHDTWEHWAYRAIRSYNEVVSIRRADHDTWELGMYDTHFEEVKCFNPPGGSRYLGTNSRYGSHD